MIQHLVLFPRQAEEERKARSAKDDSTGGPDEPDEGGGR